MYLRNPSLHDTKPKQNLTKPPGSEKMYPYFFAKIDFDILYKLGRIARQLPMNISAYVGNLLLNLCTILVAESDFGH